MSILFALLAIADWSDFNSKGLALHRAGSYREAAIAFETGMREAGTDRAARARLANNLGAAYYSLGNAAAAERAYRTALADWETVHAPASEDRAVCRLNLAVLLRGSARYADAERFALEGIAELRAANAPRCKIASGLQTLAEIARLTGRHDEAAAHLVSANKELDANPDPLVRAHVRQAEAALWQDRGQSRQAEPLLRVALVAFESAAGGSPPQAVAVRVALGQALLGCGRVDEARTMLELGLESTERIYGPAHLRAAIAANNLAQAYLAGRRLAEAEPLYRRALEIFEAAPGHTVDVAKILSNLGDLFVAQGKSRGAERLYRRALEAWPDEAVQTKLVALLERERRFTEVKRLRSR
ncbi:MAG: tetratricopeptide repeat protein [Bryobacteraceae bacterium]